MKKTITIAWLFLSFYASSQINYYETYCLSNDTSIAIQSPTNTSKTTYCSTNGALFPTKGVFRALTIAVNIIYDQTPAANPYPNTGDAWGYTTTEGINNNPPNYLLDLFDVNNSPPYNGCITRLYAESSFNQLIILSDFTVVNIKQSQITPNNPGGSFSRFILMDSVISYINQNGGLNSLYNHNSISDYDFCSLSSKGLVKPLVPDNKIDLTNFLIRNATLAHGDVAPGNGYSYIGPSKMLKIGNGYYGYSTATNSDNAGTYQCVGSRNIANTKSVLEHEIAHYFLGGNEFHTSGGNHIGDSFTNTFLGVQMGGYGGLFGGGLRSCNGYERWRLGWHPANNTYQIECDGQNGEINTQFSGERIFNLRDFVTTGDAIRIKYPYKDTEYSSEQYIWLENHQCGKNDKLDNYGFINENCRNFNQPGIFCYYQVGKDILESTDINLIYPRNEKDNLRQISAEGNYNVNQIGMYNDCLSWAGPNGRPRFEYISQNPFMGVNDLTEVYKGDLSYPKLQHLYNYNYMGSKLKGGVLYDNFPWCVDDLDPYIPTSDGVFLDISSNPSAVNTTTFHSVQYRYPNSSTISFYASNSHKDTRKTHLTGLSIKMIDPYPSNTGMKSYMVKVRWDDYDIKQDVNWAGDIVLIEQLNLLTGRTLTLEQSKTPNQIDKDPVSNYFAKTTFLTCESNSICNLATNSAIIVKEKSSLVLNTNSTLSVQNGGIITIEAGSTLQIKAGANLNLIGNAKIVIKSGGHICVESGANINLQNYTSLIVLEDGAIYGANPDLFLSPSCSSTITNTGNGAIVDYSQDVYIQNETISTNRYIGGKNIFVGNHVTTTKPYGDVFIQNGADVIFDCKEVTFDAGFECTSGNTYEVRNH